MRFLYRVHASGSERVLAICDAEIVGKIFREKGLQIAVAEDFYSGRECSEKEAVGLLNSSTIINAVGKNIVDVMVRSGIAQKGNVLYIQGVPHAQAVNTL